MGASLSKFNKWVFEPTAALHRMQLGPESFDNPLMLQFFTWEARHNNLSWWGHLESEVPQLAKMGFTQIWLPPPNKAAENAGRGYDAYDLWDLGEFKQKEVVETRWGSKEELISACNAAKNSGIDILIDAVLNHKVGADRLERFTAVPVDEQDRLRDVGPEREIEAWTAFDFAGRGEKYSKLKWTQEHFTGVDWDHRTREKRIFRITGPGHKGWSSRVDGELGNYDYLLGVDIDHRHPAVQEDFLNWGTWVLETTGAAGFRLDAIKHVDRRFLLTFIRSTRKRSGNMNMFTVSEFWSGNIKTILPYIQSFKGETAFFDVPLHMNFHNASTQGIEFDLRHILKDTIVDAKPNDAVTFVDNHDTVEGQSLQSWVASSFKLQAYAIILLRGYGHPCVFYGDLYPNLECYDEVIGRGLKLLIEARKKFAYGQTRDYFATKNCIGFVRTGNVTHDGCAVVISNMNKYESNVHTLRMNVGTKYAGRVFKSFMQCGGRVGIDQAGWGIFSCLANQVQMCKMKKNSKAVMTQMLNMKRG